MSTTTFLLLPRRMVLAPVRMYRRFISPALAPRCRYYPTCSTYAVGAIETHGLVKGLVLASARLLRCNPFSHGGVNPLPPKGSWRATINPDGTARTDHPYLAAQRSLSVDAATDERELTCH